jgi:dihydroorotate dehydrogenase
MGWYEALARPALFRVGRGDAEAAHEWTLRRLAGLTRRPRLLAALTRACATHAPREVFGIRFPNPVGLAAGMDKDGVALPAWPALGFGFVEVGTVTWHPQSGNERPRTFRLRRSEAVINRMGFNNAGARALASRLGAVGPSPVPLGISLGKSKITLLDEAVSDYLASLRVLYPYADYIAVNVSSPNTPGLRSLQERSHLDELMGALRAEMVDLSGTPPDPLGLAAPAPPAGPPKPLLVKISPDLSDADLADVLAVCLDRGVAGIIATNTTLSRAGLVPGDIVRGGQVGGLSGRPLTKRSLEVVGFIHREAGMRLPIIGVGGVMDPDDALRLVDAGASLVQLYTGLIYRGPGLIRDTARALSQRAQTIERA